MGFLPLLDLLVETGLRLFARNLPLPMLTPASRPDQSPPILPPRPQTATTHLPPALARRPLCNACLRPCRISSVLPAIPAIFSCSHPPVIFAALQHFSCTTVVLVLN